MLTCEELNELYRDGKEKIDALKLELDLEFQKEKGERDYFLVQNIKTPIENEIKDLKDKLNPLPEFLRGKEGIQVERIKIGGKTAEQLLVEMGTSGISVTAPCRDIMLFADFKVSDKPKYVYLVILKVGDLGLPKTGERPTTEEIYKRVEQLGLELCPAEVGPEYRLKHMDQPLGDVVFIGIERLRNSNGEKRILRVENQIIDSLSIATYGAEPTDDWSLDNKFVFCLRKDAKKIDSSN